jgi:hypothetical protein
MAMPSGSESDGRDALSPWERRVLAGIEDDLATSDPRLAQMIGRRGSLTTPGWWPLSVRCTGLLLVALLVLVVASVLVPASGWLILGLITTVVVVPWIVLCMSDQRGSGEC